MNAKSFYLPKLLIILFVLSLFSISVFSQEIVIKRAAASSIESFDNEKYAEKFAFDGNLETRWSSEFSEEQWIFFDLGVEQEFDVISILWDKAYALGYDIQISNNAVIWNTIAQEINGNGEYDDFLLTPQKARFIRIMGVKKATEFGYSISEVKVGLLDDKQVPISPTGASTIIKDNELIFSWFDNREEDIKGYNIYAQEIGSSENAKKINTSLIRFNIFNYKIEGDVLKDFQYYLTAVDYADNESPLNENIRNTKTDQAKNFFDIPTCAWERMLGDVPKDCVSSSPNRGIALGGFGTGSFMYNISGSIGPFQSFSGVNYVDQWFSDAAFHIYEKVGDKEANVKTLSRADNLREAWEKIPYASAQYYALHPRGWVTYSCFDNDISQEFFSPIFPNNYKEVSYPVAVWQFKLSNPSDQSSEVAVMLTFPDVSVNRWRRREEPEKDFTKSVKEDDKMVGVVIRSENERGSGEWCIAASKETDNMTTISFLNNWDTTGVGDDVWADFSDDGVLSSTSTKDSDKATALSIKVHLDPKQEIIVPIVVSWDYPAVRFGREGSEWWKKYTMYFGKDGKNSFAIAADAFKNYKEWEAKIDQWQKPVIESDKYPNWLKCAAFNELYYTQFGGSFYEGGLKKGAEGITQEYMGLHEDDNKFFEMECNAYPFSNTFDVRHYSSIIFAEFWPDIEKQILMSFGDAIVHENKEGQTPHDSGSPWEDPYFKWDNYGTSKLHWKDLHSKYIQQCWRYWVMYKDEEFLKYVWEPCKTTYGYMKTTDQDGDFLPDNKGNDNTYDSWGLHGSSLLCGGLWVGALETMVEMAKIMDDPAIEKEAKDLLTKARKSLDKQLWYPEKGYYKIDTQSKNPTAIMADGLNGQRYCEKYGLKDILPKDKMLSHLTQVYERCVVPLADFTGDGVGDCGAINGIREDGETLNNDQSNEVWTGSSYFLAASMYHAGLKKEAMQTAFGVYNLTYNQDSTAYWFNTPEAWRDKGVNPRPVVEQYQRPRAVWELLLEIDNPYKTVKTDNTEKMVKLDKTKKK